MPTSTINVEVVVKPTSGKSMFDEDAFPTVANLDAFRADEGSSAAVGRKLANQGFRVEHIGTFSISASCPEDRFEEFFGTKIEESTLPKASKAPDDYVMRAPKKGTPFAVPPTDGLDDLIDRAYIQHDPIFFAGERQTPPFWDDKFRLRVPVDVAQIMRASSVHRRGIPVDGVKVAMPDTGFYHHPYFVEQSYNFLSVTAPDAIDHTSDANGHGTGECANLFATAPDINFLGVKMNNPTLAFKTAVDLRPDVITNSWGYSLDRPNTTMPNWVRPLYLAVLDAVARGITVCFSAGNGHFAFPGSVPEVISVGGVTVDRDPTYSATRYASGFSSAWFPGRETPDICGLCGTPPTADYIVLPVQRGALLERQANSGWGAFSGTSAASPMVAGVCALLRQADPAATPDEIKNILKFTARDITRGRNAHNRPATPGPDGATGFGLVDAERAIGAVL